MHKEYTLHEFSEFLRSKPDNFRFKKCSYSTIWSICIYSNADYMRQFWCYSDMPTKRFSNPYYYLYSGHEINRGGQNSLKAIDATTKLIMMDFSNMVQMDLHDKKSITALRLKQHLASAVKTSFIRSVSANFY